MSTLWALTARELKAFWYSPIAYVVGALFLLFQGAVFWLLVAVLNDPRVDPSLTLSQFFFGGTMFSWLAILTITPLLTMRTFSEEKRTGSIEFLLTAPVTDTQVVLSKFLGAWLAYIMLWMFTMVFFLVMQRWMPIDWPATLVGYLGTWLLGGVLIAIGILTSSVTRNQVIAAVLSFVVIVLLFSVGVLDVFVKDPEASQFIRYLSLTEHMSDFSKGILDSRPVVFYVSLTVIGLFLTGRVIGSPRWRS